MKKFFLPEACYTPNDLAFSDVQKAFKSNETIVGVVEKELNDKTELKVRLGEDLFGYMPWNEATIYPFTYSSSNPNFTCPLQIAVLRGKVICAKIKDITDDKITLSRKDNMIEAFNHISLEKVLPFKVTALRTTAVFGDVGHGIQAKINIVDLCKARIHSCAEICKVGDSLRVSVLDFDDMKRVNVSYKDTFAPYDPQNYAKGDVVTGTINAPVDNNFTGFFVNISPQVVGILDYHAWHPTLHYGDVVECVVCKISPKGLRLRFLKLLQAKS